MGKHAALAIEQFVTNDEERRPSTEGEAAAGSCVATMNRQEEQPPQVVASDDVAEVTDIDMDNGVGGALEDLAGMDHAKKQKLFTQLMRNLKVDDGLAKKVESSFTPKKPLDKQSARVQLAEVERQCSKRIETLQREQQELEQALQRKQEAHLQNAITARKKMDAQDALAPQQLVQHKKEMLGTIESTLQSVREELLKGNCGQEEKYAEQYQTWLASRKQAGQPEATPQQWYMAEVVMSQISGMFLGTPVAAASSSTGAADTPAGGAPALPQRTQPGPSGPKLNGNRKQEPHTSPKRGRSTTPRRNKTGEQATA